jgi:Serine hydrolase
MVDMAHVPVVLVPGLSNSGDQHWQTLWKKANPGFQRISVSDWFRPDRAEWVESIERAVRRCAQPPIVVAHSPGCIALVHWTALNSRPLRGATLVAPADICAAKITVWASLFLALIVAYFQVALLGDVLDRLAVQSTAGFSRQFLPYVFEKVPYPVLSGAWTFEVGVGERSFKGDDYVQQGDRPSRACKSAAPLAPANAFNQARLPENQHELIQILFGHSLSGRNLVGLYGLSFELHGEVYDGKQTVFAFADCDANLPISGG